MRILFDNIVTRSEITSVNASNNYPPANLKDTSLIKRVQSSLDADTLTITPDDGNPFDAVDFWYGYTNATRLILRLHDYDGSLLYEHDILSPLTDIDHVSFPIISDVYYATLYYEGDLGVYIGGAGLGEAVIMPNPNATWTENDEDNSIISESPFGQTNQEYIRPLRQYPFRFSNMERDEMNEIKDLTRTVGRGRPLWTDPFEENHDFMKPLYAKITKAMTVEKDGIVYGFALDLKEAR